MIDCFHGIALVFQQADGTVKCSYCGQGWASREAYFLDMTTRAESPDSIVQWCKDHYPQHQNRQQLALFILEEAIELCRAVGVPREDIALTALDGNMKPISEPFPGEVADIGINLLSFAAHEALSITAEMDKKMKQNRIRFDSSSRTQPVE